jgi:hypothetical protein
LLTVAPVGVVRRIDNQNLGATVTEAFHFIEINRIGILAAELIPTEKRLGTSRKDGHFLCSNTLPMPEPQSIK